MASSPQEIIQKFILRQIGLVFGEETVNRFELFHVGVEGTERIQVFPYEQHETKGEELAFEIYEVARTDSENRMSSTPERYGVVAMTHSEEQGVGQVSFVFEGRASRFGANFEDSENPSLRGQTSQLMRHTERMHQMMLQMTEVTLGRLMQENMQLRGQIDKLTAREDTVRKAYDAAMDMKDEREIKNAEALMKAKRIDQMGGMLLSMAPAVISSLFAKKGMPVAATSAIESAVKNFMAELNQEEISGVLKALTPAHQMALLEVYKNVRETNREEDKDKPKILRASEEAA